MEKSGFSVIDSEEVFRINGGKEEGVDLVDNGDDKSKENDKTKKTWELGVGASASVDTTGKIEPKVSVHYTVRK